MQGALPSRPTLLLLALTASLLMVRLGAVPLVGPDEPRYARVAVELSRSGDFVTPTLEGRAWMEKPILYYWLAGGAFRLLGENETAARLPSVLAGVALVATTALVGARLCGGAVGLHAGFVLATSLLPFAYARAASMDMLLAASVSAAIGFGGLFLLGIAGGAARVLAFALMGVALLAKGPLGIVLPGLVLGLTVLFDTREGPLAFRVRRLVSPAGLLVLLLVAGPWYVAILLRQGFSFVEVFLLNHNLARFTSTIHNHPGPLVYYIPVLVAGLFPWSGLLPAAFAFLRPRSSPTDLFLLLWLGGPLLLFSLAGSKLPGYILPCLPPLAILMGRALSRLGSEAGGPRSLRLASSVTTLVFALLFGALPVVLAYRNEPGWATTIPLASWSVTFGCLAAAQLGRDRASAARTLRVGGAGFLLLFVLVAPPILARHESGKSLFARAQGREVLALGAWRTAWMAGYFYNDARVHPVENVSDVALQLERTRAVLVLAGPAQRRALENVPSWSTTTLAKGPRENALIEVSKR